MAPQLDLWDLAVRLLRLKVFILVLAMAATRKMLLRALDVSHAFMHSPLGTGVHVVLKMPLSISFPSGEATYYLLEKALNGLRDASLAWLQLLTFTV